MTRTENATHGSWVRLFGVETPTEEFERLVDTYAATAFRRAVREFDEALAALSTDRRAMALTILELLTREHTRLQFEKARTALLEAHEGLPH